MRSNLIDGLDGLVSGVSIISLVTMGIVSLFLLPVPNLFLTMTIFVLVASIAGFFPFNYHPAILYLGRHRCLVYRIHDFCLVLARFEKCNSSCGSHPNDYPRSTDYRYLLAIIRRTLSGQKFYKPDRNHLHHRLLSLA